MHVSNTRSYSSLLVSFSMHLTSHALPRNPTGDSMHGLHVQLVLDSVASCTIAGVSQSLVGISASIKCIKKHVHCVTTKSRHINHSYTLSTSINGGQPLICIVLNLESCMAPLPRNTHPSLHGVHNILLNTKHAFLIESLIIHCQI